MPVIFHDANTGVGQDFHADAESGRRFNSAFVSLYSGLQTLLVRSPVLNRREVLAYCRRGDKSRVADRRVVYRE